MTGRADGEGWWRLTAAAVLASTALWSLSAPAQIIGPIVPPSVPSSPQPVFPKLPSFAPGPGSTPQAPATPSAPSPAPPAESPRSTVVSARTQRVIVTAVERRSAGTVVRVRDEAGAELVLEVASYTGVIGASAGRATVDDLVPDERVDVTWFPQGDRRMLLTVRRIR